MQNQPYTELIGGISNKLNPKAIEQDIQLLKTLPSINAFSDYWVGTVRVYTLWNMNGDNEEGYYAEYCGAAQVTKTGLKLNYINEILSNTFHLDFLKFARIFELENGGFLLPHRDYLEYEDLTFIIQERFREEGIPIAIPQQDIRLHYAPNGNGNGKPPLSDSTSTVHSLESLLPHDQAEPPMDETENETETFAGGETE
ncbi:hypothetical protein MC7420_6390 [Coleofasciculus chthonoplastes PCC 7420]|uniref:Uncharacterized protein n=1 Tax=Coleofasciculus chthonoplastes PCC 7420 TaxID=118168 RepID=B4VR03_9CYAN|nr:hypothetical protein [Coleofasciculus chthonoplastes]EDX75735.1 hypothetical protein MC7420_6390 [Coleofasciculus chthonoplastes PCC 7420]